MGQFTDHIAIIQEEISWINLVLNTRMSLYFTQDSPYKTIDEIKPPKIVASSDKLWYADFIIEHNLTAVDRMAIALALLPNLNPSALDIFFTTNSHFNRPFSEFGGVIGKQFKGFIPTGETLLFVLAGGDLKKRMEMEYYLRYESPLFKRNILKLSAVEEGEPLMSGTLLVAKEYLPLFTTGEYMSLDYSESFPVKNITTHLEWGDLILDQQVKFKVEEIKTWVEWNRQIRDTDLIRKSMKPGYRCVFHGPSGTGKTLAVTLLGKLTGKEVYQIDLARLVATTKNEIDLTFAFEQIGRKDGILFLDKADLFFENGAEAERQRMHQIRTHLYQRIEDFPGVIILSTSLKITVDEEASNRFQSLIHFPKPGIEERLQLWKNIFAEHIESNEDIDFEKISSSYAISGGAMVNVLLHCLLDNKGTGRPISEQSILEGIKKELRKEGKVR